MTKEIVEIILGAAVIITIAYKYYNPAPRRHAKCMENWHIVNGEWVDEEAGR